MVVTVRERLEKAIALHKSGEFDSAGAIYRDILAEAPDQSDALHLLGLVEAQTGRPEKGLPLLRRATEVDPDISDFHADLGIVLQGTGRFREALWAWLRALELNPANSRIWTRLSELQEEMGDPVGAQASIARAAALAPLDADLAVREQALRARAAEALAPITERKPCRWGDLRYLKHDLREGRSLDRYGEYAAAQGRLIETVVRAGETAVEVNAGVGGITGLLAARVGATGSVIAWEPQAVRCRLLKENAERNGWNRVEVRQGTLSDRTGWQSLPPIDYTQPADHGAPVPAAGDQGGDPVRTERLDDLGLSRMEFFRIDAAGQELEVLKGALATIARCRPVIYMRNERDERSADLIRMLMDQGYRLWWHFPKLMDIINFRGDPVDAFEGGVQTYLFAVPAELAPEAGGLPEVLSPEESRHSAAARLNVTPGRPL